MLLGLDIGSTALRACALETSEGQHGLTLFDTEDLPSGAVINGVITQPSQVIDALVAIIARTAEDTPELAITLPYSGTRIQRARIGHKRGHWDHGAADAAIAAQIPEGWGDYKISISAFDDDDPEDVLIVAAPRVAIRSVQHIAQEAGGVLMGIDAAPAVCYNVLEHRGDPQHATAVVDVGLQESRIVLIQGGHLLGITTFGRGGQDLRESLQEALGLHAEEAERYKIGRDSASGGVVPRDVHEQLRVSCETLARGIWSKLQAAMHNAELDTLSTIHCIGRGADLSLFYGALEDFSGATIVQPAPLRELKAPSFDYTSAYLDAVRGASCFAFGTALPWTS